jgi:rhodanese-related sulfurtransferase
METINAPQAMRLVAKNEPIIACCSSPSCANSRPARMQLEAKGYAVVTQFQGGILAWMEAGYPLESCSEPR